MPFVVACGSERNENEKSMNCVLLSLSLAQIPSHTKQGIENFGACNCLLVNFNELNS